MEATSKIIFIVIVIKATEKLENRLIHGWGGFYYRNEKIARGLWGVTMHQWLSLWSKEEKGRLTRAGAISLWGRKKSRGRGKSHGL